MAFILGIESSCDESAAAVLRYGAPGDRIEIVSETVSSQVELHEQYGGVVPELAAREHLLNLPFVVEQVLSSASIKIKDLECIAVSRGPGLKGCLLMGLNFARGLSVAGGVPLVGVNHIEAHLLSAKMDNPALEYPFLALIVSGGHTEIHHVTALGRYTLLARTGDDAAGEAFDKSAALLGFLYPGGAALAKLADTVNSSRFLLPRVMREAEGFSFSGLKTAIALLVRRHEGELKEIAVRAEVAYAVQEAIVDALCFKVQQAVERTGIRRLVVAGGVAANTALRDALCSTGAAEVYMPLLSHCMDNGAMVAYAGLLRHLAGESLDDHCGVMARWPLEELTSP